MAHDLRRQVFVPKPSLHRHFSSQDSVLLDGLAIFYLEANHG